MIDLRHVGIYVTDLTRMETFYQNVFSMKYIIRQADCSDVVVDSAIGEGEHIYVTKLISPYGQASGHGDMIELLYHEKNSTAPQESRLNATGVMHISFGVDDIHETVEKIIQYGGKQQTQIVQMNQNKCCFCTDPENNWLELIQRVEVPL